jgi:hypothetical protein
MLSWISGDYFARSPVLILPVVALLVFMTVFCATALRAALARRAEVEHMARLPLEGNDEVSRG